MADGIAATILKEIKKDHEGWTLMKRARLSQL